MVSIVCGCGSGSGGSHSSSSVFQKSITITKLPSSLSLSITNTKGSPSSLFLTTRPLQPRGLTLAKMAQSCSSPKQEEEHRHSVVQLEKVTVKNNYGENLAGLLHETGSVELVILCHGFRSSKDNTTMINLAEALTKEGLSVFRFDFAGNGESEGSFQYGNYLREADDLRSVVSHFSGGKHAIITILGHSKGGNVVLLYASRYGDVPTVINVSGRYNLKNGIEERIGKDFMQNIKRDGFIDVTSRKGEVQYRITEESLMERLGTDMHTACLSIDNGCRVLTVHGSSDEVIPVEDAFEFSKIIPNHKLHIIEGADHGYSKHQVELAEVVSNFIKASLQQGKDASSQ